MEKLQDLKVLYVEIMKEWRRRKYIEALLNIRNPIRPKRKQGIENSSNMKGSGATFFWGTPLPP